MTKLLYYILIPLSQIEIPPTSPKKLYHSILRLRGFPYLTTILLLGKKIFSASTDIRNTYYYTTTTTQEKTSKRVLASPSLDPPTPYVYTLLVLMCVSRCVVYFRCVSGESRKKLFLEKELIANFPIYYTDSDRVRPDNI